MKSCARIRGVSLTSMMREITSIVLRDQMVLAILDDAVPEPEVDKTLDTHVKRARAARGSSSVVQRRAPNRYTFGHKEALNAPRTRSEMEADLQRAVLNTAKLPVE